jgi:hypothetical protein
MPGAPAPAPIEVVPPAPPPEPRGGCAGCLLAADATPPATVWLALLGLVLLRRALS